VRAGELTALGIPRAYLARLVARGALIRVARGLYRAADAELNELTTLVETQTLVPRGVVCLLSALQLHDLTTEAPHAVWLMIDTHARPPSLATALEVVRASGQALAHGTETRLEAGVRLRLTTPAKTVADCFRYRHRVGLDVAISALRDFLRRGRTAKRKDADRYSIDALMAAARVDRVARVIRPYLEALA
jgi:predicted transcriptional regulator of viral defense system